MKILANDGLDSAVADQLKASGIEVEVTKVAKEQLAAYINNNGFDALWIAQATKLNRDFLNDVTPLKTLILAGTLVDLEMVDYARSKGIQVIWPEQSFANPTAELVLAHLLNGCRFLQDSNRNMPLEGDTSFKALQASYSDGLELSGKTLTLIGLNAAAKALAQKALALGMHVVYCDSKTQSYREEVILDNGLTFAVNLQRSTLEEAVAQAHFISIHTATYERYVVDGAILDQASQLLGIVNCAFPEAINEVDLVDRMNDETILFAGIDRFEEEPHPAIQVLMQPAISLSPGIHNSTRESKDRAIREILDQVLSLA